MVPEIKPITLERIGHVVEIVNSSSHNKSFEFRLDPIRFLISARMWNLSYTHSYIAYVESRPVGCVLNAADPQSREAYSYYWGMIPEFQGRGIFRELFRTYIEQFRREGYRHVYGEGHPDSPWPLFEKLGWKAVHETVVLECAAPQAAANTSECRPIGMADLLAAWPRFAERPRSWCQQEPFLRNAEQFVEVVGAFHGPGLAGYAVLTQSPGYTLLFDIVEPVEEILACLSNGRYAKPFVAFMVPEGSTEAAALANAGFTPKAHITALRLVL